MAVSEMRSDPRRPPARARKSRYRHPPDRTRTRARGPRRGFLRARFRPRVSRRFRLRLRRPFHPRTVNSVVATLSASPTFGRATRSNAFASRNAAAGFAIKAARASADRPMASSTRATASAFMSRTLASTAPDDRGPERVASRGGGGDGAGMRGEETRGVARVRRFTRRRRAFHRARRRRPRVGRHRVSRLREFRERGERVRRVARGRARRFPRPRERQRTPSPRGRRIGRRLISLSSIDPSPLTPRSPHSLPPSPLSASLSAFTLVAPRIVAATLARPCPPRFVRRARASAFAKDAVTNVARMFAPTPPNARHISAAPLASARTVSRSAATNAARHAFASKTSNARRCAFRSFASAPRVEAQCRASNPLAEVESADASRG